MRMMRQALLEVLQAWHSHFVSDPMSSVVWDTNKTNGNGRCKNSVETYTIDTPC